MEKYDIKFKKRFGQNFINNKAIIDKIVSINSDVSNSLVIEVGPGGGILTSSLAEKYKNVLAYEIDNSLSDELNKRISSFSNVDIIYKDFLNADIASDISNYKYDKLYFVSNVPYYITSPILMKLIDSNIKFNKITMMVQKEVGDRYSSKEGSKTYGAISVILNYLFDVKKEFYVSKNNFTPKPKVDSVVISFTPKDVDNNIDFNSFRRFINDSFKHRRKTLKNNLSSYNLNKISSVLEENGYSLNSRAEEISLELFIKIFKSM